MINKKRYQPVNHCTVYFAIEYTGDNIEQCLQFDKHIGKLTNQFEIHSSDDHYAYDISNLVLIQNQKSIKFIHPGSWIVRQHGVASVRILIYTDEEFKYNFVEEQPRQILNNNEDAGQDRYILQDV